MTTAENSRVDRGPISAVLGADHPSFLTSGSSPAPVVLSFDVEEHYRIEAAVGLEVDPGLRGEYRQRMNRVTELDPQAARRAEDPCHILHRGPDR